ncbi:hypothetical protein Btru_054087 [Bulinus truncatus]|nr:hypothetical protein Btru_054087 [Bulinus truncatus]
MADNSQSRVPVRQEKPEVVDSSDDSNESNGREPFDIVKDSTKAALSNRECLHTNIVHGWIIKAGWLIKAGRLIKAGWLIKAKIF